MSTPDLEPTPLPTDYVCPDGTVPGWLNIDGLPTSCISDLPMPEPLPDQPTLESPIAECNPPECNAVSITAEPAPRELANTGTDPSLLLVLVLAVVATLAGLGMRRAGGAS